MWTAPNTPDMKWLKSTYKLHKNLEFVKPPESKSKYEAGRHWRALLWNTLTLYHTMCKSAYLSKRGNPDVSIMFHLWYKIAPMCASIMCKVEQRQAKQMFNVQMWKWRQAMHCKGRENRPFLRKMQRNAAAHPKLNSIQMFCTLELRNANNMRKLAWNVS